MTTADLTAYSAEIAARRQSMDDSLRREDGWLALAGLYWLHEGENTLGSAPTSEVLLPNAPEQVGVIDFADGQATLRVTCSEPVLVDDEPVTTAILRDDHHEKGVSVIKVRALTFFVIKRADQYGIRIINPESEARKTFTGRKWYPIDPGYHVQGKFMPHETSRTITVINTVGLTESLANLGTVTFELYGQTLTMQAFESSPGKVWFIFKDATSGSTTYGAARYLHSPVSEDGVVDLDFNMAYNPPCAFTPFATCPMPPKENILKVRIEAGELKP
jgi:uncharacterized protein